MRAAAPSACAACAAAPACPWGGTYGVGVGVGVRFGSGFVSGLGRSAARRPTTYVGPNPNPSQAGPRWARHTGRAAST